MSQRQAQPASILQRCKRCPYCPQLAEAWLLETKAATADLPADPNPRTESSLTEKELRCRWTSIVTNSCKKAWWRWGWILNSNIREELEAEACIAVVRAQPNWTRLPAEAQERYIATCVRHALSRFLACELKHTFHTLSREDFHALDAEGVEPRCVCREDSLESGEVLPQRVIRSALHGALRALSPAQRQILYLRYWRQLPWAETARCLHITLNAAKKRHERVLTKMRRLLEKRGGVDVLRLASTLSKPEKEYF